MHKKVELIESNALWKAFHDEEGDSWDEQHEIDCYSFSQCENLINDAPVIEAIPIEWIKNWISKRNDFPTMPYNQHIWDMLDAWEKENG